MSEKTITQKLMLKPGRKLLLLNTPSGYAERIGELPPFAKIIELPEAADVIQVFVRDLAELQTWFEKTSSLLTEGAILWVTYPKKSSRIKSNIDRDIVNLYFNDIGWQGTFLVAVDDDWSAMRVRPK